jgi:hypothetical protein
MDILDAYLVSATWMGPENMESRPLGVFYELATAVQKAREWSNTINGEYWSLAVDKVEVSPTYPADDSDLDGTRDHIMRFPCDVVVNVK